MKLLTPLLILLAFDAYAQVKPLPNAHAHNDYEHDQPLFYALENGFISIEADVHLVDDQLYVSHNTPRTLSDNMLLENMYIKPLYNIVEKNNGFVYSGNNYPILLMIDFKTEAKATYEALQSVMKPYRSMLCSSNEMNNCAVKIFVSGNRPIDQILSERDGYIALDGRPGDLEKGINSAIMPVISENYNKLKFINGFKNLSKKEAINALVTKAHNEGKQVRLWGAPDNESTWQYLLDNGVDLINTDKIEEFAKFMED